MRWRQDWPDPPPRPKLQKLSKDEKQDILAQLTKDVAASPVLSALGMRVRSLRGRFYVEQVFPTDTIDNTEIETVARISPVVDNEDGEFLLERERRKGNWSLVIGGSLTKMIRAIANDTKGTFHGMGMLDKCLRKLADPTQRLIVKKRSRQKLPYFVYEESGEECTVQETLYHYFGLPIPIIAEPQDWYAYHRTPQIVEVSKDNQNVLVTFSSYDVMFGGTFGGTCLYSSQQTGEWKSFCIKPNQSDTIETAIAWLEKRKWKQW